MKIINQKLDCKLLQPKLVKDVRGWFQVAFSIEDMHALGLPFESVFQVNHSYTAKKGVVRGLNFQKRPYNQAKLVRVLKGAVYSVGVDIDPKSSNYGKACGFYLSAANRYMMYLPNTYAHGFTALEDDTELEYVTDQRYVEEAAMSIQYDDDDIVDTEKAKSPYATASAGRSKTGSMFSGEKSTGFGAFGIFDDPDSASPFGRGFVPPELQQPKDDTGIDWTMNGYVTIEKDIRSEKNIQAPLLKDIEF